MPVKWPFNVYVFDDLKRCWGQPYKVAYACSAPIRHKTISDTK